MSETVIEAQDLTKRYGRAIAVDNVSFDAPDLEEKSIIVDAAYVRRRLEDIVKDEDLSRYIL